MNLTPETFPVVTEAEDEFYAITVAADGTTILANPATGAEHRRIPAGPVIVPDRSNNVHRRCSPNGDSAPVRAWVVEHALAPLPGYGRRPYLLHRPDTGERRIADGTRLSHLY